MPHYIYEPWPTEEVKNFTEFVLSMIENNKDLKQNVITKRIMQLYEVDKLPYDPQVARSIIKYSWRKENVYKAQRKPK